MGQNPSSATVHEPPRETRRQPSTTTILREDTIHQTFERCPDLARSNPEPTVPLSRPDSWTIQYACSNHTPDASHPPSDTAVRPRKMNTETSLRRLPKGNPSHDLAFFLSTTGPTEPHRRPSKGQHHPQRAVSGRTALRLFKGGGEKEAQRNASQFQISDDGLNGVLRDEGGLLPGIASQSIPRHCEQKISSTGKRYLALRPRPDDAGDSMMMDLGEPSIASNGVHDSRVSVRYIDEDTSATGQILESWLSYLNQAQQTEDRFDTDHGQPLSTFQEVADHLARQHRWPTPVRPAASEPPSSRRESALSMTNSFGSDDDDEPSRPRVPYDIPSALTSHPVSPTQGSRPPTPRISLPREEFPVKHPSPGKEVQIRHPIPRRLASHPLLHRASSDASIMYQRSVSETRELHTTTPPPPPRSPLRLRRDPRTIEGVISTHDSLGKSTPRIAPSIKSTAEFHFDPDAVRATVTTQCSGPIKEPKSRGKAKSTSLLPRIPCPYPANRREREERVKTRKMRDKPAVARTIDSVVHHNGNDPKPPTRQRLKKIRPKLQIPTFDPTPLHTPSSPSYIMGNQASVSGWRKGVESPVSPVPSLASVESGGRREKGGEHEGDGEDQHGYTPISPTASAEATAVQLGLGMSPMMLVAEEVPVLKATKTPKPPKLVLKESKTKPYKPRPRSASLPRNVLYRHRQSTGDASPPRDKSPALPSGITYSINTTPPLPSPPPTRALPPTPPQSVSAEKPTQNTGVKRIQNKDHLLTTFHPHAPMNHPTEDPISPVSPLSTTPLSAHYPAHISTQCKPPSGIVTPGASRTTSHVDARLEALEKQNALLSAALMAVLKTNGEMNARVPHQDAPDGGGRVSPLRRSEESGARAQRFDGAAVATMAWETRVARRSAATAKNAQNMGLPHGHAHAAAASKGGRAGSGSALEMYFDTRRG